MHTRLEPKIIQVFREGYKWADFQADLLAGVLVGVVALPLAIAFAIASGVKPEQGLFTAIIAGTTISILGGSRVQISGPTGAFIVVIYDIVLKYGYEGLAVATLIAGLMLIAMGVCRMGILLKFIPYPLVVGFTSGIAVIIFSAQVRDLFGLSVDKVPGDFVGKWHAYALASGTINLWAVGVAAAAILIILFWPKVTRKIPGSLVAIIVLTIVVQWGGIPVETIHSRFGNVPSTLPSPHLPTISWELIQQMFSPAFKIALLGGIESLLSAVVADGMLSTRRRSNMELVAQGIGNIISPLFQGIPATGAIARTATNVKSGGRSPVSGIIHALTLLIIMTLFGSWAAMIPMPVLAAVLVVVAYNMSEWHLFVEMLKAPRSDVAVLLVTFLLTVFIDLTVAIEVGVVLAAFLFLQRIESVTEIGSITHEVDDDEDEISDRGRAVSPFPMTGVEVFEVRGPLFFGAIERFKNTMLRLESPPKVFILRMRHVPAVDASGLRALVDLLHKVTRDGGVLLLSGLQPQPLKALENADFVEKIGAENLLPSTEAALARARSIIEAKKSAA